MAPADPLVTRVSRAVFSLLHEQRTGLQLCDPCGAWHTPTRPDGEDGAGSWILIVGDMLEVLSNGYLVATPHRVPPTCTDASAPRRSIVLFQALDEHVALAPLGKETARRAPTGGFRRWYDETRERDCASRSRRRADKRQRAGVTSAAGEHAADGRRAEPVGTSRASAIVSGPVTQREWTELKESAARERLLSSGQT